MPCFVVKRVLFASLETPYGKCIFSSESPSWIVVAALSFLDQFLITLVQINDRASSLLSQSIYEIVLQIITTAPCDVL